MAMQVSQVSLLVKLKLTILYIYYKLKAVFMETTIQLRLPTTPGT